MWGLSQPHPFVRVQDMVARRAGKTVRNKISSPSRRKTGGHPKSAGKTRKPSAATESRRSGSGRSTPSKAASAETGSTQPRLQKVLAAAGIASRRDCEVLIEEGRVEIDGEVVTKMGVRVDPDQQEIRVDGDVLRQARRIYYLVNKPRGVVSTNRDPSGRMRVVDLLPHGTRLFTVGRLDMYSEGLMLVTNDGELANNLAHPRYGVEKTYRVTVNGHPTGESLRLLRKGVHLAEGPVRVSRLSVKSRQKNTAVLEMVLTEGKNREIRRMAARIGHKVVALRRIGLGTLRLGDVPPGAHRLLTESEIKRLRKLVEQSGNQSQRGVRKKTSRPKPTGSRPAGRKVTKSPRSGSVLGGDSRTAPPKQKGKKTAAQETRVKSKVKSKWEKTGSPTKNKNKKSPTKSQTRASKKRPR